MPPLFIDSPAEIPPCTPYRIHGSGENSRHLAAILAICLPRTRFLGFVDDLDRGLLLDEVVNTIVTAPDYLRLLRGMTPEQLQRVVILPTPDGDCWGYWDFMKINLPLVKAGGGRLSWAEVAGLLARERPGIWSLTDGKLGLSTPVYMSMHKSYLDQHTDKVSVILNRLSDQASLDTYLQIINGDATGQWRRYFANLFRNVQYMNYSCLKPGDVILNGGVHSGTELPHFLNRLRGHGTIHNVDPLGEHYLSSYAAASVAQFRDMVINHELALANYSGEIHLPVGGGESPQARGLFQVQSDDPTAQCFPCLTVQDLLAQGGIERLDMIKLDLEGAEEYVLPGVIAAMQRFRPQLAIAIYHTINHFVEIPYQLMTALKDYDFHVVSYGYEMFETVFYAIPQEKAAPRAVGIGLDL